MNATKKQMKSLQENPIGMEARSKQEFGIIMKKLSKMNHEERQAKMTELGNLAGHKGDKIDDCSLCKMLVEHKKAQG